MSNPLIDTLFRPTTVSPLAASAAPVRAKGVHTRAGNAMSRTRAALLAGAARAVEASGTKITMAQVAAAGGVAKATLYNHFRTREAVLDAVLSHQVDALIDAQAGKPLADALADAAHAIATNPVRRGLSQVEPAVLAVVARVDFASSGWRRAREAVDAALSAAGRGGGETVLRWLASFVITEADRETIRRDVAVLLTGLPERDRPSAG
ncbi:MAG TPA: TetR family transcriptional regulator [Jatrophihabitans sp.]|nr:TetR family transcriptional regulator [Jatrophihabitans sp.]